jgi:hypothetical protein
MYSIQLMLSTFFGTPYCPGKYPHPGTGGYQRCHSVEKYVKGKNCKEKGRTGKY